MVSCGLPLALFLDATGVSPGGGLTQRYNVRGFRVPEDDFTLYRALDPDDAGRQRVLAFQFRVLCRWQRRQRSLSSFRTTRWCYGLFRTGRLDVAYLARLAERLPDGDLELHCHPDLATEAGRREVEALRSPEFRRALERRDVRLATYASLD